MKYKQYCVKCNNFIEKKDQNPRGFCRDCYQKYLQEQINIVKKERMKSKSDSITAASESIFWKNIENKLKQLLSRF